MGSKLADNLSTYPICTDCDVCGEIGMCRDAGFTICWMCDQSDEKDHASYHEPKARSWTFVDSNGVACTDMADLEIDLLVDRDTDAEHEREAAQSEEDIAAAEACEEADREARFAGEVH